MGIFAIMYLKLDYSIYIYNFFFSIDRRGITHINYIIGIMDWKGCLGQKWRLHSIYGIREYRG